MKKLIIVGVAVLAAILAGSMGYWFWPGHVVPLSSAASTREPAVLVKERTEASPRMAAPVIAPVAAPVTENTPYAGAVAARIASERAQAGLAPRTPPPVPVVGLRSFQLSPDGLAVRAKIENLVAGATSSTDIKILEIFELEPGMSSSYHLRDDVEPLPLHNGYGLAMPGAVYALTGPDRFYIQWDGLGASTLHYYGPFSGKATDVLGISPAHLDLIHAQRTLVQLEQKVKAGTAHEADTIGLQNRINQLKVAAGE